MPGYDDIVSIAGLKSAQIDKPDFPIQTKEVVTPKPTVKAITKPKLITSTKRGRKTKVDKLIDFIISKKDVVKSQFFTTVRARKKLIHFLRLVYINLNICQIVELLILQCLEQNKELLPDNYLELIYPDEKDLPSGNTPSSITNDKKID